MIDELLSLAMDNVLEAYSAALRRLSYEDAITRLDEWDYNEVHETAAAWLPQPGKLAAQLNAAEEDVSQHLWRMNTVRFDVIKLWGAYLSRSVIATLPGAA